MVNARKLHSFVTEHEEKLDARIEAMARGGKTQDMRLHEAEGGHAQSVSPRSYRTALWARIIPHRTGHSWPMRYELTPRG